MAVIALVVMSLLVGGAMWFVVQGDLGISAQEEAVMRDDGIRASLPDYEGELLAGQSSPLFDFVKSDYDKAVASGKLVVLYFYANWCPECKKELPILISAFEGLATDDVVGFRVNYNDTATDKDEEALARQYGVAYQHTKVFIKNGTQVLKSPESWGKDRYTIEINKAAQ